MNASQFYITTGAELDSLDGKHTIFGEVGPCEAPPSVNQGSPPTRLSETISCGVRLARPASPHLAVAL